MKLSAGTVHRVSLNKHGEKQLQISEQGSVHVSSFIIMEFCCVLLAYNLFVMCNLQRTKKRVTFKWFELDVSTSPVTYVSKKSTEAEIKFNHFHIHIVHLRKRTNVLIG